MTGSRICQTETPADLITASSEFLENLNRVNIIPIIIINGNTSCIVFGNLSIDRKNKKPSLESCIFDARLNNSSMSNIMIRTEIPNNTAKKDKINFQAI
tara:strand:+ start:1110 stop:1406 length:297 start_codon:yes stop_codon:yes gene_type:complete